MLRLAVIVSHPIQYVVPLYRQLASRGDMRVRVFFTWHDGGAPVLDKGFGKSFAWDLPLTSGYEWEVVPNRASDPGTHHFRGLQNPSLLQTVLRWKPDAVLMTGYAYQSHLMTMRGLHRRRIPVIFRGDSHLLARQTGMRWWIKRQLLRRVYRWTAACLYVGVHNRAYYRAFGVEEQRLYFCPHSIDVPRFAAPAEALEQQAWEWRRELGIGDDRVVLLFVGKLEDKKRVVPLMKAVEGMKNANVMLVVVGDGERGEDVKALARAAPDRFRVLPFQNQSRMPLVYRLGEVCILPSGTNSETWGLAVNEAFACGRPAIVSDLVGCGPDLIRAGKTGEVFPVDDWEAFAAKVAQLTENRATLKLMGQHAREMAAEFTISRTEDGLVKALRGIGVLS